MAKRHCCVPCCDSYINKGLFKFPQKESLKRLWLEALNMDSHGPRDIVCIKHFREKFDYCKMPYGSGFKYKLAEDAVPNLFLPGNSHLLDTDTLISSHESIDVASTEVIKFVPAKIDKGTQTHDFFFENKVLKEKLCKAEAEIKNLKKENQKLEKQVEEWKVLATKYGSGYIPKASNDRIVQEVLLPRFSKSQIEVFCN